jgi:hypothetical protein
MVQQTKKSNKKRNAIILGTACIVVVLGLVYGAISYQPSSIAQNKDAYVPRLVSSNINYFDNRTNPDAPFLQVVGTIQNTGNATANNCQIRAFATQDGNVTAIDTSASFEQIPAGGEGQIDLTFPYNGSALVVYNTYLEWTT